MFPSFSESNGVNQNGMKLDGKVCTEVRKILVQPNPSFEISLHENASSGLPKNSRIDDAESFHRAIGPILAAGQIVGIAPVNGVLSQDPKALTFQITSFRTLYTCFVITLLTGRALTPQIYQALINPASSNFSGTLFDFVFFGSNVFVLLIFFRLSPSWIKLQNEWKAMEEQLDSFNDERPRIRKKFIILSLIVIIVAISEHTLWFSNGILSKLESTTFNNICKGYFKSANLKLDATSATFRFYMGIYFIAASIYATVIWTFSDLFIMLVSIGLAERYKCLNKSVMNSITKNRYAVNWLHLREQYATLSSLVKRTDRCISPLIFLSFAINLLGICTQLSNGLSLGGSGILSRIYFFSSFGYQIGRSIAVTLYTAQIHDQSKVVVPVIYYCPASCFTIETKRLQHLLTTDKVALTGMNFFSITRNFILALTSAIVTYEIVMLQFNIRATMS